THRLPQELHRPGGVHRLARRPPAEGRRPLPRRTPMGNRLPEVPPQSPPVEPTHGRLHLPARGRASRPWVGSTRRHRPHARRATLGTPAPPGPPMPTRDVCDNDHDKAFTIQGPLGSGTFASLACAI